MDNNFNNDDFETFLNDQLKNHRMYPKDAVWREINQKLHGEKRWPALTLAAFLLVGVTAVICLHFAPQKNIFSLKPVLVPLPSAVAATQPVTDAHSSHLNQLILLRKSQDVLSLPAVIAHTNVEIPLAAAPNIAANDAKQLPEFIEGKSQTLNEVTYNTDVHLIDEKKILNLVERKTTEAGTTTASSNEKNDTVANLSHLTESSIKDQANEPLALNDESSAQSTSAEASLIRAFEAKRKPSKFSISFYLAPSISYRKLSESDAIRKDAAENGPVNISQVSDVNDVVRHKPSNGIEGGVSILYDLAKTFRIKAGLQFNVRQYDIDAYKSNTEVSNIELLQNNRIETINVVTSLRNYNGNSSTELRNRYYQLSMPLGAEWQVFGNKKFQFNVAGSIQPTYIVNKSAYLLTTNFKNYAEKGDMVRQWNLNSNAEAFISMTVGDTKWQFGPQVRYQPYSTFIMEYPIREHLIDYGVKLGFTTRIH